MQSRRNHSFYCDVAFQFGATSTRCEVCRWCCRIGLVVARLREHHFEIATCETLWSSDSASLTLESGSLLFSSPLLLVHQ
ncbi:hypothetical protein HN873_059538, partial [Arachis hypogaea]